MSTHRRSSHAVFALVLLLAAALAPASCEERVVRVQLTFEAPGGDAGGLDGFLCVDDEDPETLLFERANVETISSVQIVVDFIDPQGDPGCRTAQLREWCASSDERCVPLATKRTCFSVAKPEFPAGLAGMQPEEARPLLRQALDAWTREALHGKSITDDPPSRPVLLRIVATLEACEDLQPENGELPAPGGVEWTSLLGCTYTCPVRFDSLDGDLYAGLDALNGNCGNAAKECAGAEGSRFRLPVF